jgi:hypothetical protein
MGAVRPLVLRLCPALRNAQYFHKDSPPGAKQSRIAEIRLSRVKGLIKSAAALTLLVIARVASSTWAVIKIKGQRHPAAVSAWYRSTPVISGRWTSKIKQAFGPGMPAARKALGRANALTVKPETSSSLRKARKTEGSSSTKITSVLLSLNWFPGVAQYSLSALNVF